MLTKKRIHIRKHMIYPTMPISTPFKKFELLFLLSDLVDFFCMVHYRNDVRVMISRTQGQKKTPATYE